MHKRTTADAIVEQAYAAANHQLPFFLRAATQTQSAEQKLSLGGPDVMESLLVAVRTPAGGAG